MLIIKKSLIQGEKLISISCLPNIPFQVGKMFLSIKSKNGGKRIEQKLWPYAEGDSN